MSRGLGKVQRDIVETLEQNNQPLTAYELSFVLFNEGRDDRDLGYPPRAFSESIRRAIHTLTQRGMVQSSHVYPMTRAEELSASDSRLFCWLPNKHTAPARQRSPIRGEYVERMIIAALDHVAAHPEVIEEYLREAYYVPKAEKKTAPFVPSGAVPYSWLTRQTQPRVNPYHRDGFHDQNASVAINRAVKRLIEQGRIQAKRGTRYSWIMKAKV